jgi:hypothetical protein
MPATKLEKFSLATAHKKAPQPSIFDFDPHPGTCSRAVAQVTIFASLYGLSVSPGALLQTCSA